MQTLSISEVKTIQLEILQDIDNFCNKHNLNYALAYGSALGAVRHKGYIPWDDDIDLIMPRPDYDIFIQTYRSEHNEVLDLAKSPLCVEMFSKVSRKGTYMVDMIGRCLWGVNVDIFPIDPLPEKDYESFLKQIIKLNGNIAKVCPFYKTVSSKKPLWFIKYVFKRLRYFYLPGAARLKGNIVDLLHRNSFSPGCQAGFFLVEEAAARREIMPAGMYMKYTRVEFEGKQYPIPVDYRTYLSRLFDNYMELPPVGQQQTHHHYKYFKE